MGRDGGRDGKKIVFLEKQVFKFERENFSCKHANVIQNVVHFACDAIARLGF